MFIISSNNDGIRELIENADNWSYAHRISNGELSDREQQKYINNTFWKLCDTPKANKVTQERQKAWMEMTKQKEEAFLNLK